MSDSIADTEFMDGSTEETDSEPQPNQVESADKQSSSLKDIVLADAPPDNGQYVDHPLNFDGKDSTAKIVRSIEGFAGDLNKSVVLLVVGIVEKYTELSQGNQESESEGIGDSLEPQGDQPV